MKRKTGAYIRRAKDGAAYLIETRAPAPDTPAALFWEMHQFPFKHNQPPEPRREGMPMPNPTKGARHG